VSGGGSSAAVLQLGWRGYNLSDMKRAIIGLLSVALVFGQNAKQKAAPRSPRPTT
jgi:hypothetical protein